MARKRPARIVVFGILNLIGGGWDLLVCFIGCLGLVAVGTGRTPAPRPGAAPDMSSTTTYIFAHAPHYKAFLTVDAGLEFLLGLLLIVAGIGLLMMQGWGRWVSLAYVPLALIGRLVNFVYRIAFVVPLISEFYEKGVKSGTTQEAAATGAKVGAIGALVFQLAFCLYPLVLGMFMLLPSTAEAFRPRGRKRRDRYEEEEEQADDYWGERRDFRRRDAFRD
jgi:hypothetical protein